MCCPGAVVVRYFFPVAAAVCSTPLEGDLRHLHRQRGALREMVEQSATAGVSAGAMAAAGPTADSPKHRPKTSCKKTAGSTTVSESAARNDATVGSNNTDDDSGQPEPLSLNKVGVTTTTTAATGAAPRSLPTIDPHRATNTVGAAGSALEVVETSRGTTTPQPSPAAGTANANGHGHNTEDTSMVQPPLRVSPPRTPTTLPTCTSVGTRANIPTPTPRHTTPPKAGMEKITPTTPTSTKMTTEAVPATPTIPQPIRLVSHDSSQDKGMEIAGGFSDVFVYTMGRGG